MIALHCRFPDEPTGLAAIDGMSECGVAVDVIGEIVLIIDPTEPIITATLDGWHVNLRGECADGRKCLAAYVAQPVSPVRVFA